MMCRTVAKSIGTSPLDSRSNAVGRTFSPRTNTSCSMGLRMNTHMKGMLRAMFWADQQMLAAIRDCPPAQAEALPLFAHVLALSTSGYRGCRISRLITRHGRR